MKKLLLVCGPWGSGTTAVAGILRGLGVLGFGPYHKTTDTRTPNSFELVPFRAAVLSLVREVPLSFRDGAWERAEDVLQQFRARMEGREFGPYDSVRDTIFLKCPGSAPLISQICKTFQTRLIYVVRSFDEIDRSRRRRRWPSYYGREGARAIYDCMFDVLIEETHPTMIVQYSELLAQPRKITDDLAIFCELTVDPLQLSAAADFVRQSVAGPGPA